MAMTMVHVQEVLNKVVHDEPHPAVELPLQVGAAVVDPELVAPRDHQADQQVEELIAFRCSSL